MNHEISQAILKGDVYDIEEILQKYLEAGAAPMACIEAMMAGLDETGKLFERGEYFLPELVIAADTFKTGMDVLTPLLAGKERQYKGTIVLGTVRGDVHDIGKNLVGFMLESSGFRVIDLGTDVEASRFVEAVKDNSADVVALSALLTTTMLGMKAVIDALHQAGLRASVKVIVGGAPLSQKFAEDIQADAYGVNAPQALEIVKRWMGEKAGRN
jgi:5-methyltetrahydrofolate--homocysteine methyltransferase